MQVTSATSSSSVASAATNATSASVDYNAFLKLLVEELKNQDPTNPTDPTQYLSQLASFSNVEQGVQTNSKLDTLLTTASLTQAETVIGKTVASSDGSTYGKVVAVSLGSGGSATATLDTGATLPLTNDILVAGG